METTATITYTPLAPVQTHAPPLPTIVREDWMIKPAKKAPLPTPTSSINEEAHNSGTKKEVVILQRSNNERFVKNISLNFSEKSIEKRMNSGTFDEDIYGSGANPDNFQQKKLSQRKQEKQEQKQHSRQIQEHHHITTTLERCWFCIDNPNISRHLIASLGQHIYVAIPKTPLVPGHCLLIPRHHTTACTALDEEVLAEIKIFRKAIREMYRKVLSADVVFFETVMNLKKMNHTFIECIPVPEELAQDLPIYFHKALMESDEEWADHKKLFKTQGQNLTKVIPQDFTYFNVEFGHGEGYVHIIEDETKFPKYFGKETVGSVMDLPPNLWLKPPKESMEQERKRIMEFLRMWDPYEPYQLDPETYFE